MEISCRTVLTGCELQGIYGRNYQPQDIPTQYITHILCEQPHFGIAIGLVLTSCTDAFAKIRPESGEVYVSEPAVEISRLTLISSQLSE